VIEGRDYVTFALQYSRATGRLVAGLFWDLLEGAESDDRSHGERHLSPGQKTYLVEIQYKLKKKEEPIGVQNDPQPEKTASRIAERYYLIPATVK